MKKEKTILSDGRYLIYYTFRDKRERPASPTPKTQNPKPKPGGAK